MGRNRGICQKLGMAHTSTCCYSKKWCGITVNGVLFHFIRSYKSDQHVFFVANFPFNRSLHYCFQLPNYLQDVPKKLLSVNWDNSRNIRPRSSVGCFRNSQMHTGYPKKVPNFAYALLNFETRCVNEICLV